MKSVIKGFNSNSSQVTHTLLLVNCHFTREAQNSLTHSFVFILYTLPLNFSTPALYQTLYSLNKYNRESRINTSPNQKQTQEVTADSSASTQPWLTTNTQHSKRIHNSAVYLRWPSDSHANYHVALLLLQKDQQSDFLFCTFSHFTGK